MIVPPNFKFFVNLKFEGGGARARKKAYKRKKAPGVHSKVLCIPARLYKTVRDCVTAESVKRLLSSAQSGTEICLLLAVH